MIAFGNGRHAVGANSIDHFAPASAFPEAAGTRVHFGHLRLEPRENWAPKFASRIYLWRGPEPKHIPRFSPSFFAVRSTMTFQANPQNGELCFHGAIAYRNMNLLTFRIAIQHVVNRSGFRP